MRKEVAVSKSDEQERLWTQRIAEQPEIISDIVDFIMGPRAVVILSRPLSPGVATARRH